MSPVVSISALVAAVPAEGDSRRAGAAEAVKNFESLFLEILLQHAGFAQALQLGEGPEGGVAGELLTRELAHSLADQLKLGFGKHLLGGPDE